MLTGGQYCRFAILHWHFAPKRAFYLSCLLQFSRQNYRFRELAEICQRRTDKQTLVGKGDRAYRVVSHLPFCGSHSPAHRTACSISDGTVSIGKRPERVAARN